ncbi:MAG: hypothetical protein ABI867_29825, partial [Kofleriaceae bacterium]
MATVPFELEVETAIVAPRGWTLGPMIASGGTSVVYALDRGANQAVLKWGRWRDRDIRARFASEAEVLRVLGGTAAPALFEEAAPADWPALVIERIAGETLAAWMARTGDRGGIGEILALLVRLATALHAV